jgi:serine/threonine protein kinase
VFRITYRFEYDIWSLAMVLFEMMELKKPYEEKKEITTFQLMKKIENGKINSVTTNRSPELIEFFNLIGNIVFFFFFFSL